MWNPQFFPRHFPLSALQYPFSHNAKQSIINSLLSFPNRKGSGERMKPAAPVRKTYKKPRGLSRKAPYTFSHSKNITGSSKLSINLYCTFTKPLLNRPAETGSAEEITFRRLCPHPVERIHFRYRLFPVFCYHRLADIIFFRQFPPCHLIDHHVPYHFR